VTGGKLTTFRVIARDALRAVSSAVTGPSDAGRRGSRVSSTLTASCRLRLGLLARSVRALLFDELVRDVTGYPADPP
jgi:glycerol-3-phosphate dehydrogenase